MKRGTRFLLGLIAILIITAAVVALGYSYAPGEAARLQATLAPTYFLPPP